MASITGARKPPEINEIRSITNEALADFMEGDPLQFTSRTYMSTDQLPAKIIEKGIARGQIPKSGVDNLTERRILDVIGMLLNEGIITWGAGIGSGVFGTNNISITEYGQKIDSK
jgi:hypothetical protein